VLLTISFALVVVVGGILRALLGRFPAAVLMGGAIGVLAWVMLAPIFIAVLFGLMSSVFVLLGGGSGFGGGGFGGGSGEVGRRRIQRRGRRFGGGGASGSW